MTSTINARLRYQRLKAARSKGTHTAMEWELLKLACDNCCVRCSARVELVRDHITPVYQGGSDSIGNIQPLCWRCNSSKGPEDTDYRPESIRAACAMLGLV